MEPPESTLPYPPLRESPSGFIAMTDWDGTVTTRDSNDYLIDTIGFGYEKRRQLNLATLTGQSTFRDTFTQMLESIDTPFEECAELLKRGVKIDPGFVRFHAWCKANGVPLVIISSGMEPWIRALISGVIGPDDAKDIDIISNSVRIDENGKFHIIFRHPSSGYGHDKSQAILPYRRLTNSPTIFFFGDGVSDMSAAVHADLLFVKHDKPAGQNDLAEYCLRENIKHILFEDFDEALPIVADVVQGRKTVSQVLLASPV